MSSSNYKKKMKSLIFFLCFLSISPLYLSIKLHLTKQNPNSYYDETRNTEWQDFKKKHSKGYPNSTSEDKLRFARWMTEKNDIQNWRGPYKKGLNHFSDIYPEEKKRLFLNIMFDRLTELDAAPPLPDNSSVDISNLTTVQAEISMKTPPDSVDWRAAGKVSAVKDQGLCGSCWAFASAGAIESMNMIYFNLSAEESDISEQILVDCNTWESGCLTGNAQRAMNWGLLYGVTDETSYPYYSFNGSWSSSPSQCSALQSNFVNYGAVAIKMNDVTAMMNQVAIQPLSVLVDASQWFSYAGGVFPSCNGTYGAGNHFVLLVGYNETVWIIKNSWGEDWGENGYIYLDRNNAECATMLSYYASYPISEKKTADVLNSVYCTTYKNAGYCTKSTYLNFMISTTIFLHFKKLFLPFAR